MSRFYKNGSKFFNSKPVNILMLIFSVLLIAISVLSFIKHLGNEGGLLIFCCIFNFTNGALGIRAAIIRSDILKKKKQYL